MSNNFNYQIKEWRDIKDDYQTGSLVIGNGASIALHSKLGFKSLKEKAEELLPHRWKPDPRENLAMAFSGCLQIHIIVGFNS